MTPGTMIEIARFSCTLGGKEILRDISLTVREGEFLSIVGPNGSGKTTLLKCLVRILKGSGGAITVAGRPLEGFRQRELACLVAYVPQADGRVAPYRVDEFLLMARYPYLNPLSGPRRSDEEAVQAALETTGTAPLAGRLLATLSGGERQKVCIAAALAQNTKVILLDEPTTFLDPKHDADVRSLLDCINRDHGVTLVSVTHDLNAAALAGGRIVALRQGDLVFSGGAGAFMTPEVLRAVYGTEFSFVTHPVTGSRLVVPGVAP